jgi:predicted enzyme related to lactoylglutathione lyase
MSDPFSPGVGAVQSADIAVPEHDRETRFYARVLRSGEPPLWNSDLMNNLGMPIIGLGARIPEYEDLPLQWMPHFQVADVATSTRRALEAGGRELMHAKDEAGTSQWAVLVDPNGAAFGIIPVPPAASIPEPNADPSSEAGSSIGRIGWIDLTIPDAEATRDFYARVIGWSVEPVAMEDGEERYADFNMLGDDGRPKAGICHARGANADLPPVWMLYLTVGDVGASLRAAEAEGGRVVRAVEDDGGGYVYAVLEDPVGVAFALMSA